MSSVLRDTPFSVLDRSRVRQGEDAARALRDTVALACEVEALGYTRFWLSEHHSVPGVAGSAPTVLAAAVASATTRIRVGTGGVMLPNHRPMVVAEQFGVLESLFPGRIDMGLGRSVGFTDGVRRALGHDKDAADSFGAQVTELLGWFTGEQDAHPGVHALPAEGLRPAPFLLATGSGADLAAELGLPLVIGGIRGTDGMLRAVERYRAGFRPSQWAASPHVTLSGAVSVAPTAEEARRLLLPEAWSTAYSRTHGVFPPLIPPEEVEARVMSATEREHFTAALAADHVAGTPSEVAATLTSLLRRAEPDEYLVTTSTYDRRRLSEVYRLLAQLRT